MRQRSGPACVLALALACCSPGDPRTAPAAAPPPVEMEVQPVASAAAPSSTPEGPAPAPAAPSSSTPVAATGQYLSWKVPDAWPRGDITAQMKIVVYLVPRVAPDGADAVVQQWGEASAYPAAADEQIEDWKKQFGGRPKAIERAEKELGGRRVTFVSLRGRHSASAIPGVRDGVEKDGQAVLGAIVEVPHRTRSAYFAMKAAVFEIAGPEKTVLSARAELEKVVATISLE
jgi:hypothetical protein